MAGTWSSCAADPRTTAEKSLRWRGVEMDEAEILRLISTTPPRCARRFRTRRVPPPERWNHDLVAGWKLECPCDCSEGAVFGYRLGHFKPGFEGSSLFITPMAFHCAVCRRVTEIIDTDEDGAGAELAKLEGADSGCTAYRGEGPRQAYPCPKCAESRGEVTLTFSYHPDYIYDLEDDGIEFPFENLFFWFHAHSRCALCGEQSLITDIDTKW
jgi:hypothetical protein